MCLIVEALPGSYSNVADDADDVKVGSGTCEVVAPPGPKILYSSLGSYKMMQMMMKYKPCTVAKASSEILLIHLPNFQMDDTFTSALNLHWIPKPISFLSSVTHAS